MINQCDCKDKHKSAILLCQICKLAGCVNCIERTNIQFQIGRIHKSNTSNVVLCLPCIEAIETNNYEIDMAGNLTLHRKTKSV